MLVTVMIETLEGVAMAEEIAATHGVDVIILGNNDLASFSGWTQHDPRYQDAIIKVHDAALKYGKYYGNAGEQYLTGYTVSADTRMVQNGPACDGWRPAGRGRGTGPEEEPVIGLPAGDRPTAPASPAPARGAGACWPKNDSAVLDQQSRPATAALPRRRGRYRCLLRGGLSRLHNLEVELSVALDKEQAFGGLVAGGRVPVIPARLHHVRTRTEPHLRFSFRRLDVRARMKTTFMACVCV